jgi:hypothetical protein
MTKAGATASVKSASAEIILMSRIPKNLQELTDSLPAKERADIEEAIATSPYLQQIMTDAIDTGTLKHIQLGQPGANEGGSYHRSRKAINISPDIFVPGAYDKKYLRIDFITSVLGHETGHALYTHKADKERYAASYAITEGIRSAGQDGQFDATALVNGYIRSSRRDEALAEIHGWNALASRIEHLGGKPPSREEMLSRAESSTSCIQRNSRDIPKLAPGILLDADMRMSDTRLPKAGPINLEPVAQCHFDRSRAALGAGGGANYTNYYGAYLIQQLADDTRGWVRPPTIQLDMARLGLDKAQLESTGLRLPAEGFRIVDTSHGRDRPIVLHSGGNGVQGTPDDIDIATDLREPSNPSPPITEPGHAAHAMYLHAQGALSQVEAAPGIAGLSLHERQTLAASAVALSLSADGWRFSRIDHAVPGRIDPQTGRPDTLFLVQGALDDPAHRRVPIDMSQALSQSIAQSSEVSQAVLQAREHALALEQQRAEQLGHDGPQGPTIRLRGRALPQGPQGDAGGGGD